MFDTLPFELRQLCLEKLDENDLYQFALTNKQGAEDVRHAFIHPDFLISMIQNQMYDQVEKILKQIYYTTDRPLDERKYEWCNAFCCACRIGSMKYIELCIKYTVGDNLIELIHFREDEPLCIACEVGNIEIVQYIYNIDPNIEHFKGSADAFCCAVDFGHTTIVHLFLKWGVDIHFGEDYAFLKTCEKGFQDIFNILLPDMNENIRDQGLCIASQSGHSSMVKQLLVAGANVFALDDYPFKFAKNSEIVDILLSSLSVIHQRFFASDILYHYCYREFTDGIQLLFKYKSIAVISPININIAMFIANRLNLDDIVKLLTNELRL